MELGIHERGRKAAALLLVAGLSVALVGASDAQTNAEKRVPGTAKQRVLSTNSPAPSTTGKAADGEFQSRARQAILVDAETGAVMFQRNAEERMFPASMSKLMTLLLAFKAMKAGNLKPEDEFKMSVNAWRTGGAVSKLGTSAMMVKPNTKVRIDELILGVIVQSGNDAAIAIAEGIAGSEAEFAKRMTAEAQRIGMKNSTFRNSTGLFDPEHTTTSQDLALLARHIIKDYPEFYALFATRELRYLTHKFPNRNPLLGLGIGVDGMKTGFIKESGYGMVASAEQNGRRLIAVVNGYTTQQDRREDTRRMLEWGFKSFTEFRLFDANETVGHARVFGGKSFYVPLTGSPTGVSVILPRFPANQKLEGSIVYTSPLKAPIKKGDQIARLRVTSSTKAVNEVPLYAADDVEMASIWRRGLDSLAHLALGWITK